MREFESKFGWALEPIFLFSNFLNEFGCDGQKGSKAFNAREGKRESETEREREREREGEEREATVTSK